MPSSVNYHKERSTLFFSPVHQASKYLPLLKTHFPHLDACSQEQIKIKGNGTTVQKRKINVYYQI